MGSRSDHTEAAWRTFRERREAELVEPHGWLTLQGFHWLPETPGTLPGLPGTWSATAEEARVEATPDDGLVLLGDGDSADQPLDGAATLTVGEAGRTPWIGHGDTTVELLRRGGRLAIRLRAETSEDREGFTGVPTYDFDPAYVVEGTVTPYEEPYKAEVATIRDDLRQHVNAWGTVDFEIGGVPQRLVVTAMKYGLGVEFHDASSGGATEAWRQLKFDEPDAQGHVVLDFNRAVNMWFAFTDYATCPAPIEGNRITVPVPAGEKWAGRTERTQ